MRRAALEHISASEKKHGAQAGLTEADVRRMQFEFLQSLQGIMNQSGPNFSPDPWASSDVPRMSTNLSVQTDLLMRIARSLESGRRAGWHPGSRQALEDLSALNLGVGF